MKMHLMSNPNINWNKLASNSGDSSGCYSFGVSNLGKCPEPCPVFVTILVIYDIAPHPSP
jgi:hypothetical protein